MTVKAVAFDLDDTLLRDDRTISDFTVSVLRRLREAGIHVIPASGRAKASMRPLVERIGCASLFIACNGAEVYSPEGTLLHREQMDVPLAREVARFARENDCYAQTYRDEFFYFSMQGHWAEAYAASSFLQGVYVGDLEAYLTGPTSKILLMAEDARIAALLPVARAQFAGRLSVCCSKPYFMEFNPLLATKGEALKRCGSLLGFSLAEAAAFGDSLNDLSMLEAAGVGVAMQNARDDVKERVRFLCPSNMEDGVARFLQTRLFPSLLTEGAYAL